ncbi:MAG: OprD family outer membrane porin [Sulfurimonas sp.]|nr:OprD family outer membrane porin [Sulfurimonas sp.]MDD3834943.1 OprD family outer membrane porin [Sulfurimonas sp.]
MRKGIVLSLSALIATQAMGAENLVDMFKNGKSEGYVRLHHINESTSRNIAITGSVVGGKLKYQTDSLVGLSFGTAVYATHDTSLTDWDRLSHDGYNQVAGGLLGNKELGADGRFENYATIGEAFVQYAYSKSNVKFGRQEFQSPMTKSEVTLIPNLYQGIVATVGEIENMKIQAAYITDIMFGTRATTEAQLLGDTVYGITAGAGFGHYRPTFGKQKFMSMGEAAFGPIGGDTAMSQPGINNKNDNDNGLIALGVEYGQEGPIAARVWDYYAKDMFNTIYADIDYKMKLSAANLMFSAQVLHQKDVGNFTDSGAGAAFKAEQTVVGISHTPSQQDPLYKTRLSESDGGIDALYFALQAKAKIKDFVFIAAYSKNTKGHVIDPWGGNFGYTSTIFSRNENRADTDAYKLGFNYDFKNLGLEGLQFIYNYGSYKSDVEATNYFVNNAWTGMSGTHTENSDEHDFHLFYQVPSYKKMWVRLFHVERKNDTRKYNQAHTRLVANVAF